MCILNNSHTSFTLIKIKFLLPFLLLTFLYASTFTTSFLLHLLSSTVSEFSIFSVYPPSAFFPLYFPLCPLSSLIVSLSHSSVTFLTPRYVSFVLFYPLACAARQQNIAWENEGEHKAAVCSLLVNPVMIYVHSVSRYLAITPGSHELGCCQSICYTDKEANEAAL